MKIPPLDRRTETDCDDESWTRLRIVRELEQVLAEMQLRKDMNDGETISTVDKEGNVSIVWKKRKR
jgi:hypothetical protein